MKKILPAIAISFVFTALMVTQLVINGQELGATQTKKEAQRFSLFESEFSKFSDVGFSGEKIKLTQIKEPIIIINFWASWCRPCLAEFKTLNELLEKYPDKLKVIGINNDTEDARKEVSKIVKKHKLKFDSIIDEQGNYADKFKVTSVPTSIVYHKGKVIKYIGKEYDFMSKEFTSLIDMVLNQN